MISLSLRFPKFHFFFHCNSIKYYSRRLFAITTISHLRDSLSRNTLRGWTINVRNLSPLKDPFAVQTSHNRDAKVLNAFSFFFHQPYCYFRKLGARAGDYYNTRRCVKISRIHVRGISRGKFKTARYPRPPLIRAPHPWIRSVDRIHADNNVCRGKQACASANGRS